MLLLLVLFLALVLLTLTLAFALALTLIQSEFQCWRLQVEWQQVLVLARLVCLARLLVVGLGHLV
jgi:hypothetical protein